MAGSAAEHETETSVPTEDRARATPAATRVDLSPVADRIIQLQRAAGNRAVNRPLATACRTLARDPDPYDRNVSRWVKLEPPSVVFNADNVAPMTLAKSPVIKEGQDLYSAIGQYVQRGTKHLVFNCHGFVSRPNFGAPHLAIGNVLHAGNVQWFDQVAGNVGVIWVSACNILSATDGEEFCKQLAKHSGAYVVAATMAVTQRTKASCVEDTAGAMWKYINPKGEYVGRNGFIALGPSLGFTYERKTG